MAACNECYLHVILSTKANHRTSLDVPLMDRPPFTTCPHFSKTSCCPAYELGEKKSRFLDLLWIWQDIKRGRQPLLPRGIVSVANFYHVLSQVLRSLLVHKMAPCRNFAVLLKLTYRLVDVIMYLSIG